ncbi:MAG: hypothetical protein DRI26_07960, partial [Chloroflexi bacterium]
MLHKSKLLSLFMVILIVLSLAVGCLPPSTPTPAPAPSPVTVFVEPEAGTQPVVSALRQAQSSILMKMYLMTERKVIAALKDAVARGVSV